MIFFFFLRCFSPVSCLVVTDALKLLRLCAAASQPSSCAESSAARAEYHEPACDALRTGEQPKNRAVNIPNADENRRTDGEQLHWGDAEQLQEHLHELVEDDLRRFWECFARRFEREKCDVNSQLRQLKSELTAVESVCGPSDLSWIMDAQVLR